MNDENREKLMMGVILAEENPDIGSQMRNIMLSLNESVAAAGGTPYTYRTLKDMSVIQLLAVLSTNRIRFFYISPPQQEVNP